MKDNIILNKSKSFAIEIINIYKKISVEHKEYVLSKQLLKSGTSIGANVKEGVRGQSKNDFIAKMSIALKEASETEYWLELLYETNYITNEEYKILSSECLELIKILTTIINTAKNN